MHHVFPPVPRLPCAAHHPLARQQMSIQAPPNLTPEPDDVASSDGAAADPAAGWRALLDAGINDWGGKGPPPPPPPLLLLLPVAAVVPCGRCLLTGASVHPADCAAACALHLCAHSGTMFAFAPLLLQASHQSLGIS